jgi:A/G-specific adenine glycosylase
MKISTTLLDWYNQNKRDLPWRNTTDAYAIWVSEIILQQTRVAQGIDYYRRFLEAFPTVTDLAQASQTDVLRLWQGLGYYSRARNMHKAAQIVASQHQGIFPTEYTQLLTLPGIGSYTAAAIASFASNAPHAVIDGNVYRVLSRLFGIETPIDSTEGKKLFAELAQDQLDKKNAAAYNQAIMDFGATHCTPASPACLICPFIEQCEAARNHKTDLLPVKLGKTKQRERHFWYFDIWKDNTTYLQQRTQKDIWQGLYQPYLIEENLPETEIANLPIVQKTKGQIVAISPVYKHVLSHQIILARFVRLHIENESELLQDFIKTTAQDIENYPVCRLISRYRSKMA